MQVYGGQLQTSQSPNQNRNQQSNAQLQMNAVRKINNLLQSGTVSVTQSSQPVTKVVKRSFGQNSGVQVTNQIITAPAYKRCFICDEMVQGSTAYIVAETVTASTHTKLTTKIARLVGETFMVIIGVEDLICRRCYNLFNLMDKAEFEADRFKGQINKFLNKKYNILDDEVSPIRGYNNANTPSKISMPPAKMQKLNNSGVTTRFVNQSNSDVQVRKITLNSSQNNSSFDQQQQQQQQKESPKLKGPTKLYKCMSCDFKSTDLTSFDPHYRECKGTILNRTSPAVNQPSITKRILNSGQIQQKTLIDQKAMDEKKYQKMRPFKCRICTQRFETREQAQIHAKTHQPDYFKCGMCATTFNRRDLLMKHLETHDKNKQQQTQIHQVGTTQKMLQETIDEALRDPNDVINPKNIQFHSCDLCSVTFLNEALYLQHMKQHKTAMQIGSAKTNNGSHSQEDHGKHSSEHAESSGNDNNNASGGQGIPDELESIFERIHSEKAELSSSQPNADNLVITTAENATGGITFNITIPPQQTEHETTSNNQQISIDMPTLDVTDDTKENIHNIENDEDGQQNNDQSQAPVSMPSLDDDGQETQQSHQSNTEAVPMELDEIQSSGDGQQMKFIVNENGQLLSLDNHILTTDAEGNQILVQGTDIEQLQALLQSGSIVMQGEDGLAEGQTLQMLATGDGQNQQMVIIQGPDGQEAHMIDASLIDADGNIVIQQPGGEFSAEGATHITTDDGSVIPVSFATGAEGEHITVTEGSEQHLQLLQQHAEGQTLLLQGGQIIQQTEDGQLRIQHEGQLITQSEETHQGGNDQSAESQEGELVSNEQQQQLTNEDSEGTESDQQQLQNQQQSQSTDNNNSAGDGGGAFLNFDELIQPQIIQKVSS